MLRTRASLAVMAWRGDGVPKCRAALFLLGWYFASISILFTNKYILSKRKFEFPFTMAATNNIGVFLLALLTTRIPTLRPAPIELRVYLTTIVPIGALTALDIGFANWSLSYLSISLHTIVRGTIPIFVLFGALILGLEKPSLMLFASVVMVSIGISIASLGEIRYSKLGLGLALLSCTFSGSRWALTQVLVQQPAKAEGMERHRNPLDSILYVSPACAFFSLLGALICEPGVVHAHMLQRRELVTELAIATCLVALLVFALLFFEFGLVQMTSSLSLSIFGIFKELVTILLAAATLGDVLSLNLLVGFSLTCVGILAYHSSKTARSARLRETLPEPGVDATQHEYPASQPRPPASPSPSENQQETPQYLCKEEGIQEAETSDAETVPAHSHDKLLRAPSWLLAGGCALGCINAADEGHVETPLEVFVSDGRPAAAHHSELGKLIRR
ncbi:hypothetical protein AB1Y20_005377 [Prymnesium parvum]|uniref:Sugar phosphate transporter domain-containing protein n=1 Tax=Prymnesium parvum TaxID=97485 RepID=A0AB34J726_PRYPA